MRAAAIILLGLSIGMALDGHISQTPFLLAIALACALRYYRPKEVPSHGRHSDDDAEDEQPAHRNWTSRVAGLRR